MTKIADLNTQKMRENIQRHFWGIVGSTEHINLPKLQDAIRKEVSSGDDRFVDFQVQLMQTEGRVKMQEKNKVWIKHPPE